jgi:hypothetical protein
MDTALTVRRATLIAAVVIVALASVWLIDDGDDMFLLAAAFVVLWVLCLVLLVIDHKERVYRASAAYLVLFGLFHGGLLISIVLGGSDDFVSAETFTATKTFLATDGSWMYRGHTTQAVHLTMLGMTAFTIAAAVGAGKRPVEPEVQPELAERSVLAVIGLLVQLTGLVIFVATVLRAGGLKVLMGGYLTFRDATEFDLALGYAHLFLAVGPVLAVVAGGRARVAAWAMFVGYAAIALLIGNRGEVLFPLVVLMVVEARRGRIPRPLWTVIGTVGTLLVISLIRQTRLSGLSGASSLSSSPLDAIAEMGYSLRPATVVLGWHSSGEPFRAGETLVAVPLRFIETLTGWHGGEPHYDDRLFNVEIMARVGPIGGSPIAESYHNFGTPGVILFMATIGLVLAWLDRAPRTPRCDARLGLVLLPLLLQVRNSFAPLPLQLALGLLTLWVIYHLAGPYDKRRYRSPAPMTTATG